MPDQLNITNIPSNRIEFIDPRTGLVSREWYRFFLNLFNLAGAGSNQVSLDELQIGPPPQPDSGSGGGGSGTVTSVGMSVPTGLSVAGSPITTSGTFAVSYAAGYAIPTTAKQTEWDTAYTDRLKWDGGATDLVAATGRTSLGATTVGGNFFTLPDPSAITFVQINADNTITTMDAPTFRTAIGAGTGVGSVTSVSTAGTVNGLTLTGGPITSSGTITLGGTLDLSSPPTIGNTTPNTGTFTTLIGGGSSANYGQLTGGATTKAVEFKSLGSDTNVALALRTQGTGAIDLAAGSRGVNISNGGTVTAITRTATSGGYTSAPIIAISAPTTAGGVQATVTGYIWINTVTLSSGGTGYTVGDVLSIAGGSYVTNPVRITVTGVSAGVITTFTFASFDLYNTAPSNPASVTGGTGSGATFTLNFSNSSTYTITNAGSGYVEQPTVSFSGGGGSGAAAYATVGSASVVRSLGSSLQFYTPAGEQFRVQDSGATSANYWIAQGIGAGNSPYLIASGSDSNVGGFITSKGTGALALRSGSGGTQLQVAHTASAVNYVQVTGAATGGRPTISAQGSDSNIGFLFDAKGTTSNTVFRGSGGSQIQFIISNSGAGTNYLQTGSSATGVSPSISCQGSDTNIDLTLTPKGTGVVRTSGTGIRLYGSSSGYVGLTGAAAAGSTTYTLPAADGTTGQMLSTNGSGTLSWATGGGSNITAQGLWENNKTISSNYSITSGNNALSAGPITVASGVVVTVPSGSVWTIV